MGKPAVALYKSVFPNLGISLLRRTPVTAQVTSGPHCVTLWGWGFWELMQDIALDADFVVINKQFCLCPNGVYSSVTVMYIQLYIAALLVSLQVG